ncbi:MAG: Ig-like domain-containing protein [Clostridia bacterium]|nr:Ig-like domain-containing protein [Clostridia bacterium]
MNKLFKKLFVLILALTVAFAAVGCDDCNGEEGGGGGPYVPDTSVLQPETPIITMKGERSLVVGDEVYLAPTTKNVKGDLVWVSENTEVATVSNDGIVKANKAGTSKITASYNGVTATCDVTVSYGSYIPNLATYSGIEVESSAKTVLSVGGTYALGAYVDFNNNVFNDATFTYSSSDDTVLTVDTNGNVTPVKSGENVTITVTATWRDFTVSKSFSVDVKDNVLFYVDGDILQNIVVNTPASYIPEVERDNEISFNPSVKVGPNATVDTNVTVEVIPMDGTVLGVDYTYDASSKVYTALALGKSLVKMSYVFEGNTYMSSFTVEANRPVKEIALPVDLYSAGAGTFKVDNGDGTYTNKTLVDYAWGNGADVTDVTLYDAYQDGELLKVNGEIVEDVKVNFDAYTDTSVTLGTKTECYTVYLNDACSYYISDANDLIGALEKTDRTYSSVGLYVLMNDIDMTGAPAIRNRTSAVKFHGVFDGLGHVIYNPVADMSSSSSGGFFGWMQSGSILRNTAFVNINSIGYYVNGGWITSEYSSSMSGLSFENIYIDINENMEHRAGMFVRFRAKASNFVINERTPANFDKAEWFATGETYYGAAAFTRITSEFNSTVATNKINNLYLISRKPLQYTYTDSRLSEPKYNEDYTVASNGSTMTYGENETELHHVYDYFTNPVSIGGLGLKNPTVQSVMANIGDVTKITTAPNVRVYESFSEMSLDSSDRHAENLVEFTGSPYWTIVDGMPIWNAIYSNTAIHDDYFGLIMGSQSADYGAVAKNYSSYELGVSALNPSLVSDLEFSVPTNDYVTIANNVLTATAVSNGTTVTVTANFKYNGVDKTKTFEVEVVNPFDVTINEVIFEEGASIAIDGEYVFGIAIEGTNVDNVTYASNDATVLALKSGTTDTFTALKTGTATITATFTYNEKSETRIFNVEVRDPIVDSAVLKVNGAEVDGEIEVSAYTTATVEVVLNDVAFDASKLAVTSSNTDVTVSGNVITAIKYVENATSTINVTLTEKGRTYNYSFVLKVTNPFKLVVANVAVSNDGKALDLYSESALKVTANGETVEGATFTTTATNVTIADGKLTVDTLGVDATLTATFTYGQNANETITIPVTFFDSVANNSVITADGVEVDSTGINLEIPDNVVVGIKYNDTAVENVTLSGNVDAIATVEGTKLTAVSNGSFTLTVTFVVDGKNHVLTTPVSSIYPYVTIDTPVNYDADTGALMTTAIEGNVFGAIVGDEILNTTNGGLVVDGTNVTYRAKTSLEDTNAGIPYKWNKVGESNVFELTVQTDANTYVFTNVSYWTMIIDNVDELKKALGTNVDYAVVSGTTDQETDRENTLQGKGFITITSYYSTNANYYEGVYNVGIYKLGADIDMEKTGIEYATDMSTYIGGYAGLLDGAGYSIKNFAPNAKGLLDVMNTYCYGSFVGSPYGTAQIDTRSLPANPTIRNIAFEDVVTTTENPVIARITGQAQNFQGRDVVIENVYVTVSNESTGFAGVVKSAYRATTMNNVYVINTNDYDNFMTLNNSYRIATREGVTVDPAGSYYIPFTAEKYRDVSLIGKLADSNATKVSGVVQDITNVYVVSKLPVMYYNDFLATDRYAYNYITVDTSAKTALLSTSYLGGYNGKKYIAFGYASNETQGNILTAYKLRDNIMSEFTASYDAFKAAVSTSTFGYNFYGYFCETCGEATLGGAAKTLTTCPTENCDGTPVKNFGSTANGFWNSPVAYEWTVHNVQTDAATEYATTNGTLRFDGVKKYASVDTMKSATNDFSSFTGEDGNGMWNVVEGELVWVGA